MIRYWNHSVRYLLPFVALAAWFVAGIGAHAAPTLEVPPGDELKSAYQTGESATLKLRYTDANGDPIKKSDAIFTDESTSGALTHTATDIDGTDTSKGVTITWTVNGFNAGPHHGHFEVTSPTATARYPTESSTYYSFSVEAPWIKWAELIGGVVICIVFLPFVTYLAVRSINPRSDPSRAARLALFIGILAACALFVYLFAGLFSVPILIGICVVAVIAGLVTLLGRR